MSKKEQPFKPQADSRSVRIRKSYYTFSKEYPDQPVALTEKRKKTGTGKRVLRICLLVFCFLILAGASFFVTDVLLRISEKPVSEDETAVTPAVETNLIDLKALSVSPETLSSKSKVRACIRQLKRKDCNSVVIDFKTDEGFLTYTSAEMLAIRANCNQYETAAVREALSLFQKEQIQVIAGVHCFNDEQIARYDPKIAVKYLGTDVVWLDASEESGGKPWLDPYQTKVRAYLKAVISEISALGVNGILLKDFSFPVGEATDTATFSGDEDSTPRNRLLKNLMRSIKSSLPESCALLLTVDADDMAGNAEKFNGSIFPNDCDGVVCNTAKRPQEVILDKEDGYATAISLYHTLIGETNNSAFILEIPKSEASNAYLRALSRNGYSAYIIDR